VEAARLSTSLCSRDTFCSVEDDAPILAASKQTTTEILFLWSENTSGFSSLSVWLSRKTE